MKILTRYKISSWVCLIGLLLILPPATAAHPLDEFYQVTYITMSPNRITLQIELYTGVLIAPRILTMIDTDQDDHISAAESQAYVDLFLKDVTFEVDDRPTSLTATNLVFPPPLDLRAGVGVIRFNLYTALSGPLILPAEAVLLTFLRHLLQFRSNLTGGLARYR